MAHITLSGYDPRREAGGGNTLNLSQRAMQDEMRGLDGDLTPRFSLHLVSQANLIAGAEDTRFLPGGFATLVSLFLLVEDVLAGHCQA